MPIPIVRSRGTWSFDTREGKEELLARRIQENERSAIRLCIAYGDAQREYHREPHDRSGVRQYAQRIRSNPGLQDGLYWDTAPNVPPSPLDPLAARAGVDGYKRRGAGAGPSPFHGYYSAHPPTSSSAFDVPPGRPFSGVHTFVHVLSGLNAFIVRAIAAVFGPRSFWYTTPS